MSKIPEQTFLSNEENIIHKKSKFTFVDNKAFFILLIIIIISSILLLLLNGHYGFTLFICLPFTLGFIIGYITNKKAGALIALLKVTLIIAGVSLVLIITRIEGFICILMALGAVGIPTFAGLILGSVVKVLSRQHKTYVMTFLLLLNPSVFTYDLQENSKIKSTVTTTININAPAEKVWDILTQKNAFTKHDYWLFKAGVNYPHNMMLQKNSSGCYLHCTTTTGPYDLKIDELITGKKMKFSFQQEITPMKEMTIYKSLDAKHLHGYFIPTYGQFEIKPIDSNHCQLIAQTAFTYDISPEFYWKWWADYIVDKMHQHVIENIKEKSEE